MTHNKQSGFSLIELMVVIGIVGILAMLAIPNYQGYTTKARCLELFQLSEPIKLAMIEEHLNGTPINELKTSQLDLPNFGGRQILKNLEVNGPKLTMTANHQKLGLNMSDREHLKIHFTLQADNHHQFEWGCEYELSDRKWQKYLPKLCQSHAST